MLGFKFEPALISEAIRQILLMLILFQVVQWTDQQVAGVLMAVSAVLALFTRHVSMPVATIEQSDTTVDAIKGQARANTLFDTGGGGPRALLVPLFLALTIASGACARNAPPSLSPTGVKDWQANQAVVALISLQRTAIALNGIQVCEPAPCRPLVSDANTHVVVDAVEVAGRTIEAAPGGWKIAASTALSTISQRLDANGLSKLQPYITAAQTILSAF